MHAAVAGSSPCDAAGAGSFDALGVLVLVPAGSASTFGCHTNGIAIASSATAVTATAIIRAFEVGEPADGTLVESTGPIEVVLSSMSVLCLMSAIDVTTCNAPNPQILAEMPSAATAARPRRWTKTRGSDLALRGAVRLRPSAEDQ